jgi:hypothetical protein
MGRERDGDRDSVYTERGSRPRAASSASDRPRSPRSSFAHAPALDSAGAAIARAPSAPLSHNQPADVSPYDRGEGRRGSVGVSHAHANMSALEMQQAISGGAKFARFRAHDVDPEAAERRRQQQLQQKLDLLQQMEEKNGGVQGLRHLCLFGPCSPCPARAPSLGPRPTSTALGCRPSTH